MDVREAVEKLAALAVEHTWSDDGGSWLAGEKFEEAAEKVLRELWEDARLEGRGSMTAQDFEF